jgi:hypothetical protein
MGQYYNPQAIVDNLILNYDFANSKSYVGSGITINNLIQSSFGATVSNSPTFSTSNLGYLTFAAASSQFGTFPDFGSVLSTFTVEAWYYLNSLPAISQVQSLVTQVYTGVAPTNKINFSLGFNGADTTGAYDGKINGGFFDGTWRLTPGFTPSTATWYQSVVTYDGTTITQYTNGSSIGTKVPSSPSLGSASTFNYLMRRWDTTNFIDGRLAIVRIYNRALSANEILKNYNANKGRFGL